MRVIVSFGVSGAVPGCWANDTADNTTIKISAERRRAYWFMKFSEGSGRSDATEEDGRMQFLTPSQKQGLGRQSG
jgi:hypothetical protein